MSSWVEGADGGGQPAAALSAVDTLLRLLGLCIVLCALLAVAAFSLPAGAAAIERAEPQPAVLLTKPLSRCPAAAPALPLPRTSHLLQDWWGGQSLLVSTLSLELGASLLRLLSSPASQSALCSRYHTGGGLFFDSAAQRYWTRLGSGDAAWIAELSGGDCRLCNRVAQTEACPPAASARAVPARCRSECSAPMSSTSSASHIPALRCSVCRQLELNTRSQSAAWLRLLPQLESSASRPPPRRRRAVRQAVDDAMAGFFFSLSAPAAAADSLSAWPPVSRAPGLLFQSLHTDWWQALRLHQTLLSAPQHLPLLYVAATNASAAQPRLLPATPRTAASMSSSSALDPPYSIATAQVEALLSRLPLQLLAELKGGGGGGGGIGWQIGCQHGAGGGELDVLVTAGGGGGGGYRISGGSGRRQAPLRSLRWEGGGGIGAGLQFDCRPHPPASLRHTVGGGGGGSAVVQRSSAGVSTLRSEQGASADRRIRLPPQLELAAINASLSSRLRQCLHAGRPVLLTGGGGGGGGQRLLLRLLPTTEGEEAVSAVASTRTALAAHFSLRIDPCFLTAALPPSAGCAAVLPFPHSDADAASVSAGALPAPQWRADEPPLPVEPDSRGAAADGGDGSLALQLSESLRICLQELGLPAQAVSGGQWRAALCPCLQRALLPVHELGDGEAVRDGAAPLFPCALP